MPVSPGIEYREAPEQASHVPTLVQAQEEKPWWLAWPGSLALTCGALGRRQHCISQPRQGQHNHTKKRGGGCWTRLTRVHFPTASQVQVFGKRTGVPQDLWGAQRSGRGG